MTKTISYHAQYERQERINYIIDMVRGDFGEMICSSCETRNNCKRTLTNKGLIILTDIDTNRLVTMYFGTVNQIVQLYTSANNVNKCPKWLMKIAHKAQTYNEKQP